MTSFDVQEYRAGLGRSAQLSLRTNAPLAVALGGLACLAGFVLVGPLVSRGVADDAGVMSFLLGESARSARSVAPALFYAPKHRQESQRPIVHTAMHVPRAHKRPVAVRRPASVFALVAPTSRLRNVRSASISPLTDATLRRGDAVMTTKGIRIFQGARHYPFAVGDFRPLAYSGHVGHRGALLAIDRVIREPNWSTSFTPAWPKVADPKASVEVDAKMRVIDAPQRS